MLCTRRKPPHRFSCSIRLGLVLVCLSFKFAQVAGSATVPTRLFPPNPYPPPSLPPSPPKSTSAVKPPTSPLSLPNPPTSTNIALAPPESGVISKVPLAPSPPPPPQLLTPPVQTSKSSKFGPLLITLSILLGVLAASLLMLIVTYLIISRQKTTKWGPGGAVELSVVAHSDSLPQPAKNWQGFQRQHQ